MTVLGLFFWLFCGVGSHWLADSKGYSPWMGFLVGVLGGPLGLLIYAGAPDLKARFLSAQSGDLIANRIAALASPTGRRHLRWVHKRTNPRAYETQRPSGEGAGQPSGESGAARPWQGQTRYEIAGKPANFKFPGGYPPEGAAR